MGPVLLTTLTAFFYRHTPILFEKSDEYKHFTEERLEDILTLGDRLIAACLGRPEFTKIEETPTSFSAIADSQEQGKVVESWRASARWLEHNSEHWLKAVLWAVEPDVYQELQLRADEARRQNRPARFNLFEVLARLDLLSKEQADRTDSTSVSDPVRKHLWAARVRRNETHDPGNEPEARDLELAIALFAAPLIKRESRLRQVLSGLIVRPLELEGGLLQTLRTVTEVQRTHVERFAGRVYWIERITERIGKVQETGGYLILTGPEGQGKSALAAKVADSFAQRNRVLGSNAAKVLRDAPWLPGALLHFGKQSARPDEIVALLAAQANAQLTRPVPMLPGERPERGLGPATMEQMSRPEGLPERAPEQRRVFEKRSANAVVDNSFSTRVDQQRLQSRQIHWMLQRLVEEHGSAVLIVDALDEVTRDGSELAFLPEPVPKGAVVFVTARPNLGLDLWLKLNRTNAEAISLDNLTRAETPLLTRVDDDQSERAKRFNDEAHRRSNGWAYVLAAIGREVERANGRFGSVSLTGVAENLLDRQIQEWRRDDHSPGLLHACLILLAVFEPCCPLSVDEIQSYLLSRRSAKLSRADTVELLRVVGPQVEGLTSGRVKLAQSVFAQHVRSPYLSSRDLETELVGIASWLGEDPSVGTETIAAFITAKRLQGEPERSARVNEQLLAALVARGASVALSDIGLKAMNRSEGIRVGIRCLELAGELDEPKALNELGDRYLNGDGLKTDSDLGARLLLRAAELGYVPAMVRLGNRLLDGAGLNRDLSLGEQWLRRASETDNVGGQVSLALRLILGDGLLPERDVGFQLLKRSAERDSRVAGPVATFLIDGLGVERNPIEGIRLLRTAAANGQRDEAVQLAERLCDGLGIAEDPLEGQRLLLEAAEAGHLSAMNVLGQRMIEGRGLARDQLAGERWLRRANDEGSNVAAVVLSRHFLPGGDLPSNESAALTLLRTASERGGGMATREIARRCLYGDGVRRDVAEGRRLLEKAVDESDMDALRLLSAWLVAQSTSDERDRGERLLREASRRGDDSCRQMLIRYLLNRDAIEARNDGERLLREEAAARNQYRIRELADRLINADGIALNVSQASTMLRTAATQGFVEPMIALATWIDQGEIDQVEPNEMVNWLRTAARYGDAEAGILLARHLFESGDEGADKANAEALLVGLVERGSAEAITDLADRLFDGRHIGKDKLRAQELLRRGIRLGHSECMLDLAQRLIDGDGVDRDIDQGLRMLTKLTEAGDWSAAIQLGERLIGGHGVPRDREAGFHVLFGAHERGNLAATAALGDLLLDGVDLAPDTTSGARMLREAAAGHYAPAMFSLGLRLVDGTGIDTDVEAGRSWLLRSCQLGHTQAMRELAIRILSGKGLEQDLSSGETWLRKAARRGNIEAMVELGSRLLEGVGIPKDVIEAQFWLRRAGRNDPLELSAVGIRLFESGKTSAALEAFIQAFESGSENAGNNIAYMARRGEIDPGCLRYPISHYLAPGIDSRIPFNQLNLALSIAAGFQHKQDWAEADRIIRDLGESAEELVEWWHALSKEGDSEGDLVLGWLARHQLILDPDGLTYVERLTRANNDGWNVPQWLLSDDKDAVP